MSDYNGEYSGDHFKIYPPDVQPITFRYLHDDGAEGVDHLRLEADAVRAIGDGARLLARRHGGTPEDYVTEPELRAAIQGGEPAELWRDWTEMGRVRQELAGVVAPYLRSELAHLTADPASGEVVAATEVYWLLPADRIPPERHRAYDDRITL